MIKFNIDTKDWTIPLSEARKIDENIKVNQFLSVNQAFDPITRNVVNVCLKVVADETGT